MLTISQWQALVEDKKPRAAMVLEQKLLELLFGAANGDRSSTDFDSELASIIRNATNGSEDVEGDKIMELTTK